MSRYLTWAPRQLHCHANLFAVKGKLVLPDLKVHCSEDEMGTCCQVATRRCQGEASSSLLALRCKLMVRSSSAALLLRLMSVSVTKLMRRCRQRLLRRDFLSAKLEAHLE